MIYDTLSAELEGEFDIRSEELSPELQLCVDRIDMLRKKDHRSWNTRLAAPAGDYPIEFSVAHTAKQYNEIFQLRRLAFAEAGWIDPETDSVTDPLDDLPTSVLVSARADGRLVGSLRVSIGPAGSRVPSLPCEIEFPQELREVRARYQRPAEFCRVAIDPELSNRSFRTTLYGNLVRSAMLVAQAARVDFALAAVHSKLSLFYQHMIGFKPLAKSDGYGVIQQPTHLLGGRVVDLVERSRRRNKFFHVGEAECLAARQVLKLTHPRL